VLQRVVATGLWLAALFGGAGRLNWTRGWIYVAACLTAALAVDIVVRRANPAVLQARAKWRHKDTEPFDRVFLVIFGAFYFFQPAVAGLDAVRFGWSSIPFWVVYPSLAVLALGSALVAWTLAVNPHAESTVRIQTDRGHTVISTGPYRIVRHPMYVGIILGYVAGPLVLGSIWALAMSGLLIALFVARTALEDQTLHGELPGYKEYAARTRYRLVPRLW
jgi:protein-S-isoprenylcysteine O-methyltransferase Ste14